MKQAYLRKAAIATACFACAAMFSLDWSERNGVSLSIESAQARVGRPLTPMSGAGVARRHARRGAYGAGVVGAGVVGAGLAAGAVAAATSPYGSGPYAYYGSPYYYGGPYHWSKEYATINGITCTPGTAVKLDDGQMHNCP
jgi:hypothetical protein